MSRTEQTFDTVVVGGGLAGMTAGAILACAGQRVVVLEKGREPGGRAQSQSRSGFQFNLGPHALYRSGRASQVLRDLKIPFRGSIPGGGWGLARERIHRLPAGLWSLLGTTLLSPAEKWEFAQLIPRLLRIDARSLEGLTVREWVDRVARRKGVRQVLEALVRVSTYSGDFVRQSAAATLEQLQIALAGGVWYLDGGWQSLVNGLRDRFIAEQGELICSARATLVEPTRGGGEHIVHLADGEALRGMNVVVAAAPTTVAELLPGADPEFLSRLAALRPVLAATLDLALSQLPVPQRTFVLGVDVPLYFSVHSKWARLGPEGTAMIHAAKYLTEPATDPEAVRRELEEFVDRCQPGWRDLVVDRRFMPHLVVSNMLVPASHGRESSRPGPACPGLPGVYLAGDWIGDEGMLADASMASASLAARRILDDRRVSGRQFNETDDRRVRAGSANDVESCRSRNRSDVPRVVGPHILDLAALNYEQFR